MSPRPKTKPRKTAWQRSRKPIIWLGVLGLAAALVYGISTSSGVAYSDDVLHGVDFSILDAGEKRSALQSANRARCPCGCNMSLAQCVATDMTCPLRTENLGRIRSMVTEVVAARNSSS
ncbi:MAG: hypothetical protein GEU82_17265 [Luteitalea sp.]|nr:hypothetical protein [Luteitalea sp.]